MSIASTEQIRAHFPALRRRYNGHDVAYFDGPGGTQVPTEVAEAMTAYLYHHNANAHWAFPSSAETDETIASARTATALFLNADPDEIVFGANMTTLAFHLSRALAPELTKGDEVVVTELDHHANIAPWTRLAQERGAVVRTVRMDTATGTLDWGHFDEIVGERTRLVAVGAASNALGTINDVAKAAELARGVGAEVFVDAVHYAPHELVDVERLDCDYLACSAYKFYGPHVGILYVRRGRGNRLDFPKLSPAPDAGPERAETGTLNHEGLAGVSAAIAFLSSIGSNGSTSRESLKEAFDALHRRGGDLLQRLWSGLEMIPGVELYGPTPGKPRTPTLSFTVEGKTARVVAEHLASRAVFVSHGDFYAQTVRERLGVEGLVRVGCACYTTEEEIERLIDAVAELTS